eukprot:6219392-Pyramimonas_sp.AAC.1
MHIVRIHIENLRHTRDVAHPGRCPPSTIRVFITRLSHQRICGSFDHSHPDTSRGQEDSHSGRWEFTSLGRGKRQSKGVRDKRSAPLGIHPRGVGIGQCDWTLPRPASQ